MPRALERGFECCTERVIKTVGARTSKQVQEPCMRPAKTSSSFPSSHTPQRTRTAILTDMASQRFLHSIVSSSSSSGRPSRPGKNSWQTLAKWAMSRSSSEASLSSTILKGSDNDDPPDKSQMRQGYSSIRNPPSSLRGDTSRLERENVERKRMVSDVGSSPETSPRKAPRRKHMDVASSTAPPRSAPLVSPVATTPHRSFWTASRHKEAASDSVLSTVRSGKKSAPEQKSPDRFTAAKQRQNDTHLQLSSRNERKQVPEPGASQHKKAASNNDKTPASTPSSNVIRKEMSALQLSRLRQGHSSSILRTPGRHKQVTPQKAVKRRVGYRALQEIKRLQSSTVTLIPRLPFARVVRELLFCIAGEDFRMQKLALKALHEASEAVIVAILEGANILSHHARRVTLMNRDLDVFLVILRSYGSLHTCLN